MSQNGNYLAIIENSDIAVYSATTGVIERTIILDRTWTPRGITLPDQSFSFSNDGSTIAIIDGSILKVWDRASGTELFTKSGIDQIQVGSSTVSEIPDSVSMSQNGTIIAVGSEQRAVFLFDRSGNQLCKSYDGPSDHGVLLTAVKVSDDGKHVAAFAQDTAALFTITPQYAFLILAGSAIAAATIILGYLGRKRLGKIMGRWKSRGRRENPPGVFGPPHSTDLH
jgi:WD40 repeat protein